MLKRKANWSQALKMCLSLGLIVAVCCIILTVSKASEIVLIGTILGKSTSDILNTISYSESLDSAQQLFLSLLLFSKLLETSHLLTSPLFHNSCLWAGFIIFLFIANPILLPVTSTVS